MAGQDDSTQQNYDDAKPVNPLNWKNPPKLTDLVQDRDDAKVDHDKQKSKIRAWLDNLNIEGSAKLPKVKGRSSMQPKLIRKQAEWRYSSLSEPFLSSENIFKASPVTWEDVEAARQNQLVLNNQFNTKLNKTKFIDSYVRTAVDEGTVVVKVGWEFEEEEIEEEVPILEFQPNPQMAQVHEELHVLMTENPTEYQSRVPEELRQAHDITMQTGTPVEPIVLGYEMQPRMKTLVNKPSLEICDYRNVIIDPSCRGDLDNAGFIIYSFETSLSRLRKEGKYFNLENINAENNSPLGDPDHETKDNQSFEFTDKPRKLLVAHEYWGFWDYNDTGVAEPFVATWIGDTLIRLDVSPFPDKKLPFITVQLLPVRESIYGEPDGELLIENQKIIGAVTRGMIDLMGRSANGQMGRRKDALDAVNRRRYEQGKDYEYNQTVDPRLGFYSHTYPEIPQSASFMLQLQNQEAESMSGVKAFSQGINSDALGDVATGIRGAIDAAGRRETAILRRLAAGMTQIGRKVISMNQEFLDDEEIIRVTNENFVAIRREDLAGNMDLILDISTAEEDNLKAQELSFMLQTMGNNLDFGMVKIILRDIARLRKMPELAHHIEGYEPEPDPLAQAIQEAELRKIEAEIVAIQARATEDFSDADLNQAKVRETMSKADKTDLDFVEQESGVTQERQKELQGEQARGNIALEREKARLKPEESSSALDKYLG